MVTKLGHKTRDCTRTHDAILNAAQAVLRESGFKRMTMDEVASRAGLGKGTIYLYFESKDDLALSVIDRSNAILQDRLRGILKAQGTARARLRSMMVERVMYRFECAQTYSQGVDDLLWAVRGQLQERRERYHHAESLIFAEALIEGRTLGEFLIDDPFPTADAFITATQSLLPYNLGAKQLGSKEALQRRVEVLADLLLKSVQRCTQDHSLTKASP
jgi:TetR/AcrR family fatty acid metabolism transcriptional regulator